MDKIEVALAKTSALLNTITSRITEKGRHGSTPRTFDPPTVSEYFEQYKKLSAQLKSLNPDLFSDLPERETPQPKESEAYDGRGYVPLATLTTLTRDLEHVLIVWEKTQGGRFAVPSMSVTRERVFFAGEYFDALERVREILSQAKQSIVVVDGYVNEHVLNLVSSKNDTVEVQILTKSGFN